MKKYDRLAKIIAKGKWHYVIIHGVLGWGILTASLFIIWTFISDKEVSKAHIVFPLILFPLGGYFLGASMWFSLKKQFNQLVLREMKQPNQSR